MRFSECTGGAVGSVLGITLAAGATAIGIIALPATAMVVAVGGVTGAAAGFLAGRKASVYACERAGLIASDIVKEKLSSTNEPVWYDLLSQGKNTLQDIAAKKIADVVKVRVEEFLNAYDKGDKGDSYLNTSIIQGLEGVVGVDISKKAEEIADLIVNRISQKVSLPDSAKNALKNIIASEVVTASRVAFEQSITNTAIDLVVQGAFAAIIKKPSA